MTEIESVLDGGLQRPAITRALRSKDGRTSGYVTCSGWCGDDGALISIACTHDGRGGYTAAGRCRELYSRCLQIVAPSSLSVESSVQASLVT